MAFSKTIEKTKKIINNHIQILGIIEETRKQKGTGLGLYIVKKMVNQHQGIIEVKRNKPKGSIFVASFR